MAVTAEVLTTDESTLARQTQRLAFFLKGLVDPSLDRDRREALVFADLLKTRLPKSLKDDYRVGMELAIDNLNRDLLANARALALTFPEVLARLPYSGIGQIIDNYSVSTKDDRYVVYIPVDKITAHKALPYPETPNEYAPQLDIRVQTSFDQPTSIYSGPNQISEVSSPGRWHRLPLHMIEVANVL